tara:strand:- start:549 stop:959 length:411 start_codon:yes stop_codon:yes gene_type:complete
MIEQRVDVEMVERGSLRGHEEVIPSNLEKRISKLLNKGFYKPIIVDAASLVILDGHHKWTAAGLLDLDRVPVIMVEYIEDDTVLVDVWPDCEKKSITKDEVLEMGISDGVFPPKTSRHSFSFSVPSIQIPLEELRG